MSHMPILCAVFIDHQIRHQRVSKMGSQPGDSQMATLIFLKNLCGYVWVNILTLSPARVQI